MAEQSLNSQLPQVKLDAERLTLRRIRENAEDQGLPVPPRAAQGDRVLPKSASVADKEAPKKKTASKKAATSKKKGK